MAQEILRSGWMHICEREIRGVSMPQVMQGCLDLVSITLDIYTHREDEDQVEAVEIFAKHREKLAKKLEQNQASKS